MLDLDSEAIDFRAASELFAPVRKLWRHDLEMLRLLTTHQGRKVPTVAGLEVENPGILPFGLTVADLPRGVSKLRNRAVGRVFHELGLVEQWGSGVQRMISVCRDAVPPVPAWPHWWTGAAPERRIERKPMSSEFEKLKACLKELFQLRRPSARVHPVHRGAAHPCVPRRLR